MTREDLVEYSFWGIIAINLFYLNGFLFSFTKITAPFSSFLLLFCIIIFFNSPKIKNYSTAFNFLILFYLVFLTIGTLSFLLFPENTHVKLNVYMLYRVYISSIVIYVAIYQYCLYLINKKGIESLLRKINIAFTFLLLPLFFTVFGKEIGLTDSMTFVKDFGERQIGIFSNPNTTGLHANYTLCICFFFILSNRKGLLLWILLIPVCCYAAFLSLSKAAMLMCVMNIFLFVFFNLVYFLKLGKVNRIISATSLILIISSILFIAVYLKDIVNSMSYTQVHRLNDAIELSQGKFNAKTTSDRAGVAEIAFIKIKEHLFIGNGIGSFHRLIEMNGLGVHNTSLLVLGESGIFTFLVFFIFLFIYIYKAFSVPNVAYKYLLISIISTYMFISFLTGHNGLEERISNTLIGLMLGVIIYPKLIKPNLNLSKVTT